MTRFCWLIIFVLFISGILSIDQNLTAQTLAADRVTTPVDDRVTVSRPGNRFPLARAEYDTGAVPPGHRMDRMLLVLQPDAAQERALEALLAAQQDPQSPQYHQWLTPESFGKLFGISDRDLLQVTDWLLRHGFEVEPASGGRRTLLFSGTAAQVEAAFHTQIHTYIVNGKTHYANSSDPEIPLALAAVIQGVASLHDFQSIPLHQGIQPLTAPAPEYSEGSTHYMAPADFATIYDVAALYGSSLDGTGQSIAIVGRTEFRRRGRVEFPLHFRTSPQRAHGGPEWTQSRHCFFQRADRSRAGCGVVWRGGQERLRPVRGFGVHRLHRWRPSFGAIYRQSKSRARHELQLRLVRSGNRNIRKSVLEQPLATGSGARHQRFCRFRETVARPVATAPARAGAASGPAVNGICSTPYSTCVGGTQFNDVSAPTQYWATTNSNNYGSALSYIPESVWNGSAGDGGSGLWASGGGASGIYSKPVWQTGSGVPSDGQRDVPDVSLNAAVHDAYLFGLNGQIYLVGGTSAAAPNLAGILALAVQHGGAPLGNANPTLIWLGRQSREGGSGGLP